MSRRTLAPAALLLAALAGGGAWWLLARRVGPGAGSVRGADVVLVTLDTLRHDALGFAGNRGVETPTLDALAAAGRRANLRRVVAERFLASPPPVSPFTAFRLRGGEREYL
jgi:hypothetical protein